MKLLLDTCTLLWMLSEPDKLSERIVKAVEDTSTELYVSTASLWELQLGRKQMQQTNLDELIPPALAELSIETLPIVASDVWQLKHLPLLHQDPFDRLLIAQAKQHKLVVATPDQAIVQYGVSTVW